MFVHQLSSWSTSRNTKALCDKKGTSACQGSITRECQLNHSKSDNNGAHLLSRGLGPQKAPANTSRVTGDRSDNRGCQPVPKLRQHLIPFELGLLSTTTAGTSGRQRVDRGALPLSQPHSRDSGGVCGESAADLETITQQAELMLASDHKILNPRSHASASEPRPALAASGVHPFSLAHAI